MDMSDLNEVKRQQFKKKLDELAGPVDLLGDPGLDGLFDLLRQALDERNPQPEQVTESLAAAVEAFQANLPDLSGLVDVPEIGQALLGLAGELLANLGDLSS